MLVSFCVVARNEEKNMPAIFDMIMAQDYPHDQIEVVFVDSMSTDNTKKCMEQFAETAEGFYKVQVLENEKIKQAPGWNMAIRNAGGDVIIRVDAHGYTPSDFVRRSVRIIEDGEYVGGGPRPNIVDEKTKWKETLLTAESSMFGSSIAPYRKNTNRTYVKSVFHGIYRREVFEKVGVFDERLGRTEDNEMHYRIRKAGYKICFDPSIISYQHVRSSLKAMLKQKYGNGFWIGRTVGVCPGCLSVYHFVPGLFFVSVIFTSVLAVFGYPVLFCILMALYGLADICMTISAFFGKKVWIGDLLLPAIFFLLHMSYGAGTIFGLLGMYRWKNKIYLKAE